MAQGAEMKENLYIYNSRSIDRWYIVLPTLRFCSIVFETWRATNLIILFFLMGKLDSFWNDVLLVAAIG